MSCAHGLDDVSRCDDCADDRRVAAVTDDLRTRLAAAEARAEELKANCESLFRRVEDRAAERDEARTAIERAIVRAEKAEASLAAAQAANAAKDAQIAKLREVLRLFAPANATETYDRIAEDFRRETGLVAPGKDVPAAMQYGAKQHDEARRKWQPFVTRWWASQLDAALKTDDREVR
jgi:cell division protein FtsB